VAERTSWLALVRSVFHPLAFWSIRCSSVAVGVETSLGEGLGASCGRLWPTPVPSLRLA
jgi:hypothetical protein